MERIILKFELVLLYSCWWLPPVAAALRHGSPARETHCKNGSELGSSCVSVRSVRWTTASVDGGHTVEVVRNRTAAVQVVRVDRTIENRSPSSISDTVAEVYTSLQNRRKQAIT